MFLEALLRIPRAGIGLIILVTVVVMALVNWQVLTGSTDAVLFLVCWVLAAALIPVLSSAPTLRVPATAALFAAAGVAVGGLLNDRPWAVVGVCITGPLLIGWLGQSIEAALRARLARRQPTREPLSVH